MQCGVQDPSGLSFQVFDNLQMNVEGYSDDKWSVVASRGYQGVGFLLTNLAFLETPSPDLSDKQVLELLLAYRLLHVWRGHVCDFLSAASQDHLAGRTIRRTDYRRRVQSRCDADYCAPTNALPQCCLASFSRSNEEWDGFSCESRKVKADRFFPVLRYREITEPRILGLIKSFLLEVGAISDPWLNCASTCDSGQLIRLGHIDRGELGCRGNQCRRVGPKQFPT